MVKEIIFRGVSLEIEYEHQKGEYRTIDYPGCNDEYIIEEISIIIPHWNEIIKKNISSLFSEDMNEEIINKLK